jgi:hypothetical protein
MENQLYPAKIAYKLLPQSVTAEANLQKHGTDFVDLIKYASWPVTDKN